VSRGGKTFDFSAFYSKFSENYPGLKQSTYKFLEWFIGFSEGEGSFILAKNIFLICLLFNGNIVSPARKARFLTFLSSFNEKPKKILLPYFL
jgi:hypothetical protein